MLQRHTQTEKYWDEDFQVGKADIDYLYNVLLEREAPLSLDELALLLVRHRVSQEESALKRRVVASNVYRPDRLYEVGDELTFPALDYIGGEVVGLREGINPDDDRFTVIEVKLEDGRMLEFACGLSREHVLTTQAEEMISAEQDESIMSSETLFIEYGGLVADALEEAFTGHEDLIPLAGQWFPRSFMADVNVGHLNLAEAVLDMAGGGPLTTLEILDQIGMMDEINEELAEFSMNYALLQDERFDEVGSIGHVTWYLTRMEPPEVLHIPERLAYEPIPYDAGLLTPELGELELEIGDEHSKTPRQRAPRPQSVTITLTYAHHRAGTLPLTAQLRRMFPTARQAPRVHFKLVDAETGEEMTAWVVREGGYVYGLADWLRENDIPVGGYLTIERTDERSRVLLDYARRKPRKDWIRTATVENNRLHFSDQQWSISCDYDDLMIIGLPDPEAIDTLWKRDRRSDKPLHQLVLEIAQQLAALTPQKNFHAKTLYSAVNLVRRCPPGPIFATLVGSDEFQEVGHFYWTLQGTQAD